MKNALSRMVTGVGFALAVYVLSFWLICLHNIPSGYRFMESIGVPTGALDVVYYPMWCLTEFLFGEISYGH